MNTIFTDTMYAIGINTDNQIALLAFYILAGTAIVATVIRTIVYFTYKSAHGLLTLACRPLKTKEDIKQGPSALLNKTVKGFIETSGHSAGGDYVLLLADRNIMSMSILGWKLVNITKLTDAAFTAIPAFGLTLALAFGIEGGSLNTDGSFSWILLTAVVYLAVRLLSSFFDPIYAREALRFDLLNYINKEVGKFYSGDLSGSIINFKGSMQKIITQQSESVLEIIQKQNETIKSTIDKLDTDVVAVMRLLSNELTRSVSESYGKLTGVLPSISSPLEEWRMTIEKSEQAQTQINDSGLRLKEMIEGLGEAVGNFKRGLDEHSNVSGTFDEERRKQQTQLAAVIENLLTMIGVFENQQLTIQQEIDSVKTNQSALDVSLQQYAVTLEKMSTSLGDGIGSIVSEQLRAAADDMAQGMQQSLQKQGEANETLYERMGRLFDEMFEQTRNQTQVIIKMKEQMELGFEAMNDEV